MLNKIKKTISNLDRFLFKKFGSEKSIKFLENMKEANIIFSSLNEVGKEAQVKFVGGCVRKSLCGEKIEDIDLATSITPDEVKKKLSDNNIRVIETGISHGTVTAILNKKKFEITTLRKDISTDGRHADVEFTTDWQQDALRRDFTINAIFADIDGRIFDPLNGVEDLKKGKVSFIGSADERIKEDYLRILRYFRFFLQYSKFEYDRSTVNSIKLNISGLNKISKERIFQELIKILSLGNLHDLFSNNMSKEIILNIFPQLKYFGRLKKISSLKPKSKDFDFVLILALLIIDQSSDYEFFCHKYKTSNNIKNRLKNIADNFENFNNKNFYSQTNIKKLIYLTNKKNVKDLLLFSMCLDNKIKNLNIEDLIEYASNCNIPKFPISGDDLKEYGFTSGEILGKKLKILEETWIENNFEIDKKNIEKYLSK
tara:strand:- start:194 stop:1477 length:1284 start_codon:yes stop_codon:yes gene_type:complete